LIFVVAGLGRGTGSGAAPVVARVARESGALVLGVAALPFEFEGVRRQRQAQLALRQFQAQADAVLCLPNQQVFKLVAETTPVSQAFRMLNELISEGLLGIWRMITRPGLLDVNFGELCAVVRGRHADSRFARVEASGEHRARVAVEKLLAHPLLDAGGALSAADGLLVSVRGGPDLTMAEVNRLMEQINAQCPSARLVLGVAVEEDFKDRLSLTVVTNRHPPQETESDSVASEGGASRLAAAAQMPSGPDFDTEFFRAEPTPRPAPRFVPPAPDLPPEKKQELLVHQRGVGKRSRKGGPRMKQTMLPLEIIHKGRFAKSEPTILDGEDLDVPTYIRRGVPLN
jgi:cell division protein FtsZ